MLSRQTKSSAQFVYHPLADANITLFPTDGSPKRFILKAVPFVYPPVAEACGGRVRVEMPDAGSQTIVSVNGKRTERYTIVYTGRKHKKQFARY